MADKPKDGKCEPKDIRESLKEFFEHIEKAHSTRIGLKTGYRSLDDALGRGLQPGELVVLYAKEDSKDELPQALAAGIALHNLEQGVGVYAVGGMQELMTRFLAYNGTLGAQGRLDARRLRSGLLKDADWPRATLGAGRLAAKEWNLKIDQRLPLSAGALKSSLPLSLAPGNGVVILFEGLSRLIPTQPHLDLGDDPSERRRANVLLMELKELARHTQTCIIVAYHKRSGLAGIEAENRQLADALIEIGPSAARMPSGGPGKAKKLLTVESALGNRSATLVYAPCKMLFIEKAKVEWPEKIPLNIN